MVQNRTIDQPAADASAPPPDRAKILAEGATLYGFTNVAPGTWGYLVRQMECEGLLTCRYERGPIPNEDRYIYTPRGEQS